MSFSMRWQGFLALAVATSLMAGCGAPQTGTQPTLGAQRVLNQHADDASGKKRHGMLAFLAKLELTDEQKTQIKALKDAFKAGIDKDELKTLHAEIKAVLLADTVDKAKLTTLLTQACDKKQAHMTQAVDLIAKVREILTEAQRTKLAAAILDKFGMKRHGKGMMRGKMHDDLGLTKEQKKVFRGMKKGKKAMMAAIGSFMLTGDKEALTAAFTMKDKEAKIQKMVDALAGMTKAQREKLVEKMEKKHKKQMDSDMDDDMAGDDTGDDDMAEETPAASPEAQT